MERHARQMLKFLVTDGGCDKYGLIRYRTVYQHFEDKYKRSPVRSHACLRYLEELKYISSDKLGVCVNHEAIRRVAIHWDKIKDTIIISVVVPLIVSLATTLITIWLTGIFR